jgi:hypothetical protein
VKASKAKIKLKEMVMKNSIGRHILSAFMVASLALAVGNMASAADKTDQSSKSALDQNSASMSKDEHGSPSFCERNLHSDGVQFVEAQVYFGNTCFTPVGSCRIFNGPLPVGTSCWCGSPYYGPFGTVGLP